MKNVFKSTKTASSLDAIWVACEGVTITNHMCVLRLNNVIRFLLTLWHGASKWTFKVADVITLHAVLSV